MYASARVAGWRCVGVTSQTRQTTPSESLNSRDAITSIRAGSGPPPCFDAYFSRAATPFRMAVSSLPVEVQRLHSLEANTGFPLASTVVATVVALGDSATTLD